jgi:intracellular sulfur oxidation DsrE/DsrF family protein
MKILRTAATLLSLLAIAPAALAAQARTGPILQSGGEWYPVPDPNFTVPTDMSYKIAFDVRVGAPGELTAGYGVAARMLNQSAGLGVKKEQLDLVVVIHGTAAEDVLQNAEYRARKGKDNANIALLEELSKAGVRIVLCGQSAGARKIARNQMLPFIQVAPSATWAHAVLQRQGFTVNPF